MGAKKGLSSAPLVPESGPPAVIVTYPLPKDALPATPRGGHTATLGLSGTTRSVILVTERTPHLLKTVCDHVFAGGKPPQPVPGPEDTVATGETRDGLPITVVVCGTGASAAETAIVELACANELEVASRVPRAHSDVSCRGTPPPMRIIRVGVCESAQESKPPGSVFVTVLGLGLDAAALHYDAPVQGPLCETLEKEAREALEAATTRGSRFANSISPYATKADTQLVSAILSAAGHCGLMNLHPGITVSTAGNFAPLGRIPLQSLMPTIPGAGKVLSHLCAQVPAGTLSSGAEGSVQVRTVGFDHETTVILHICNALQYRAGSLSLAVRRRDCGDDGQVMLPREELTEQLGRISIVARLALEAISNSV